MWIADQLLFISAANRPHGDRFMTRSNAARLTLSRSRIERIAIFAWKYARPVSDDAVVEWLLAGDPVLRWQVMRDLLDEPVEVWEAERRRTLQTGWVAEILSHQGRDGEWPTGRWTASVWALLLLVACGLPEGLRAVQPPVERLLGRFMPAGAAVDGEFLLKRVDLCHLGFWLGLGAHVLGNVRRLPGLASAVLAAQMDDRGWNCRARNHPDTHHSSFHTTFNVLENLRLAAARGAVAESAAVLRGLDYLRLTPAIRDSRLDDAIQLLHDQRKSNGRWPLQKRIPGTLLVEMERPGSDSRWNALRALRVLRCRESRVRRVANRAKASRLAASSSREAPSRRGASASLR
jgi:hypothetical protein